MRDSTPVRLVEPDGNRNMVVTLDYAINYCKDHPGWTWEYLDDDI